MPEIERRSFVLRTTSSPKFRTAYLELCKLAGNEYGEARSGEPLVTKECLRRMLRPVWVDRGTVELIAAAISPSWPSAASLAGRAWKALLVYYDDHPAIRPYQLRCRYEDCQLPRCACYCKGTAVRGNWRYPTASSDDSWQLHRRSFRDELDRHAPKLPDFPGAGPGTLRCLRVLAGLERLSLP